jgi:methylglutaconyl-CoA hydratase
MSNNNAIVEVSIEQAVARVWLNQPSSFNAIDEVLIVQLTKVINTLTRDDDVRVIVLGGRGVAFSKGADLNWMLRAATLPDDQNFEDACQLTKMFKTIHKCSKPIIARVHGTAIGAGVGLLSACDISIASDDTIFAIKEVRVGIMPAALGVYVVGAMGASQARRYFLTGEEFTAQEAWRTGLVHTICSLDSLDAEVDKTIELLLQGSPVSQHETKRLVDAVSKATIDVLLAEDTAKRIAKLRATKGAQAGITAMLNEKPAPWVIAQEKQAEVIENV